MHTGSKVVESRLTEGRRRFARTLALQACAQLHLAAFCAQLLCTQLGGASHKCAEAAAARTYERPHTLHTPHAAARRKLRRTPHAVRLCFSCNDLTVVSCYERLSKVRNSLVCLIYVYEYQGDIILQDCYWLHKSLMVQKTLFGSLSPTW